MTEAMMEAVTAQQPRPREAVRRMAPYVPPISGRQGKLRLDFNENTVGASPRVARLLQKLADPGFLAVYPEYTEARERMASFLGVGSDELLFTNGTDEAIHSLINTYVDAGDEVVIPSPTYSMFRFYVELAGAMPREIPYRIPDLAFPLDELLDAVSERTRAVLIANPNNPIGSGIDLDGIEEIAERAHKAAVLIDEAYFEFHNVTAIEMLALYPNIFVSRTFSKAYGMAGLRIGCLLSQAENIAAVAKGQSPYSVNAVAAACALEAIDDQEYLRDYVREVLEARTLICEGLDRLSIAHYPSCANFVLAQLGERSKEVCGNLRERGILIRDRGHEIPGAVRITAGSKEQARRFLTVLEEVL